MTDRSLRPSDSSAENDSIVFTYTYRFSKLLCDNFKDGSGPSESKDSVEDVSMNSTKEIRCSEPHLQNNEQRNMDTLLSDTENASPSIRVEEDMSQSSYLPYYVLKDLSPTELEEEELATRFLATGTMTQTGNRSHSNSCCKNDGNVFRYDFMKQVIVPKGFYSFKL